MSNLNNFANPWDKITDEKNYTCTRFAAILVVLAKKVLNMKVLRNENPKRFAHAKLRKIGCPLSSNASSRAASTSLRGPSCFRSKGITTFAPNDTFFAGGLGVKSN